MNFLRMSLVMFFLGHAGMVCLLADELFIDKPFGFDTVFQQGSTLSTYEDGVLTSVFPKDLFDSRDSGFSFVARLGRANKRMLSYEVKFHKHFNFVKGGKLPGLCGGRGATGGDPATGENGFSARLMWRQKGQLVSYVYHVNQSGIYGDDYFWLNPNGKPLYLKSETWYKIRIIVEMNDINSSNGSIKGYIDDVLAFEKNDFVFRTIPAISVDRLCFNTFFGGNDSSWAPKKAEKLYIRNLVVD